MSTDDFFGGLFGEVEAPAAPAAPVAPPTPAAKPAKVRVAPAAKPGKPAAATTDARVTLVDGVEYRTLYLWPAAYDAMVKNHEICQEFSPADMGDLLILQGGDNYGGCTGTYTLLAELVAVRDECSGQRRRYIWKFDNVREVVPRPGVRELCIGRVTFQTLEPPAATAASPERISP